MKNALLALSLFFSVNAQGQIFGKPVTYRAKDTVLEGYVAYDDSSKEKRPGVLVVHDWLGVSDFVKVRALQLAKMGFVAFVPDIYGKGVRPASNQEAEQLAGKYKKNRALMRERALAGLDELKREARVDNSRVAAIGYCFGGTVVLELARAGADLKGVVSFHGGLSANAPAEPGKVKAKVVVYHGAEDPNVSDAEVKGFEEEMRKAKVDWTLVKYGNAVHAFTNPQLQGKNAYPGSAEYNEAADKRSWISMQDFFKEWFQ